VTLTFWDARIRQRPPDAVRTQVMIVSWGSRAVPSGRDRPSYHSVHERTSDSIAVRVFRGVHPSSLHGRPLYANAYDAL
jgi:hypothetical protein